MSIFTGTYTGHTAALNVSCGFQPGGIVFYNSDDATLGIWVSDHGAAKGFKDTGTPAEVTTNGITTYAGGDLIASASDAAQDGKGNQLAAGVFAAEGFTVGTDADYNTDGEVAYFTAYRSVAKLRTMTAYEAKYGADEGSD